MKQIALLRGINVGKSARIAMPDLRQLFEGLGFTDVATHLQSGNVIFSGRPDVAAIETAISERFAYQARVVVIDAATFESIVEANPLREVSTNPARSTITFLDSPPPAVELPADLAPERVVVTSRAVYQWLPEGVSKSKMPPSFFRTLGPAATARNIRTCDTLVEMLKA